MGIIDMKKLTFEIKVLASALRSLDRSIVLLKKDLNILLHPYLYEYIVWGETKRYFRWYALKMRFTKLCAFKATLKGKMHFSPKTNRREAQYRFGIILPGRFHAKDKFPDAPYGGPWIYPGSTLKVLINGFKING